LYSGYHESNVDLHVHTYGYEDCEPSHQYGPAIREYYLFHYIFRGKGIFEAGNQTHHLREGQGFLNFPKDLTIYKADNNSPWSYGWFGVSGLQAEKYFRESGLTRENPIWNGGKDLFIESYITEMNNVNTIQPYGFPQVTGYTYLVLARLIEKANKTSPSADKTNRQESYLRAAIRYIEEYYYKKVTIEDVSRYVGLDRSYLGSLFKKHLNLSMQDFLINFRIERACSLLENTDIRIGDVARSVGYPDQLQFSRVFKNRRGISPTEFRKGIEYKKPHRPGRITLQRGGCG